MTSTAVRVNTTAYATTHVATNMLKSIRKSRVGWPRHRAGLLNNWAVLENGVSTWLGSGHLQSLVLEVFDPTLATGKDLVGRFDFVIDYGYYGDGNGELWLDPDTVSYASARTAATRVDAATASWPTRCPENRQSPDGSDMTFRSTNGFTRHTVGAAIGGGSLVRPSPTTRRPPDAHRRRSLPQVPDPTRADGHRREGRQSQARNIASVELLDADLDISQDFLTGAYGRYTKTKPLHDVDIMVVLTDELR